MRELLEDEDALYVALTKQQTKLGISVDALVLNVMLSSLLIVNMDNPFMGLFAIPIHICFYFVSQYDPYFFAYIRKKMENKLFLKNRLLKRVAGGVSGYVGS